MKIAAAMMSSLICTIIRLTNGEIVMSSSTIIVGTTRYIHILVVKRHCFCHKIAKQKLKIFSTRYGLEDKQTKIPSSNIQDITLCRIVKIKNRITTYIYPDTHCRMHA